MLVQFFQFIIYPLLYGNEKEEDNEEEKEGRQEKEPPINWCSGMHHNGATRTSGFVL